ncbi:ATP-binding cassette domain-containing protein [Allobacillus sp. GCM10007491]|uniref:ABC transporter ATP-binding protein n=1 Tax=Allobacillus saliphilus TaxID=2912308 RepID=A0A941HTM2_9BACI|nr:ABC transporter ATP-binding protein [Allobacillus saliphilus]MBR7554077.1 ABC transporter ATP-binding protein [Allobacillus saliphilus]
MNHKLEIKRVSKSFKKHKALNEIDFTIEGDKIVGLIGRNGAGKTTLLSLIAGLKQADHGEIILDGEPVFENQSRMQQIMFLSDSQRDESMKVQEMLEMAETFRPNFDTEYAAELIKKFNLPTKKTMKQLSKGMRSALQVVLGLASRAPITIFDEVYTGMDAPTRKKFYNEVLDEQAEHPRMFILSTHLVSEMDYLFDEIVMIHEGKLLLHDKYEAMTLKGQTVIGEANAVDQFVSGKKVLNEQRLGPTKSVTIYGELSEGERQKAKTQELEIGNVSLQDLFIHLTGGEA